MLQGEPRNVYSDRIHNPDQPSLSNIPEDVKQCDCGEEITTMMKDRVENGMKTLPEEWEFLLGTAHVKFCGMHARMLLDNAGMLTESSTWESRLDFVLAHQPSFISMHNKHPEWFLQDAIEEWRNFHLNHPTTPGLSSGKNLKINTKRSAKSLSDGGNEDSKMSKKLRVSNFDKNEAGQSDPAHSWGECDESGRCADEIPFLLKESLVSPIPSTIVEGLCLFTAIKLSGYTLCARHVQFLWSRMQLRPDGHDENLRKADELYSNIGRLLTFVKSPRCEDWFDSDFIIIDSAESNGFRATNTTLVTGENESM